eukprot:7315879-Pyramimonas_sp.AAC.1
MWATHFGDRYPSAIDSFREIPRDHLVWLCEGTTAGRLRVTAAPTATRAPTTSSAPTITPTSSAPTRVSSTLAGDPAFQACLAAPQTCTQLTSWNPWNPEGGGFKHLQGTLPTEIGILTHLTKITFDKSNAFRGTIPT